MKDSFSNHYIKTMYRKARFEWNAVFHWPSENTETPSFPSKYYNMYDEHTIFVDK